MNKVKACKILDIESNANVSEDIIKKKYRIKALQNHPDKGGNNDDFIKINTAYEFLINKKNNDKNKPYEELLTDFLNSINLGMHSNLICTIFKNIILECEEKTITFMSNLNKSYLLIIINIIKQYENIFYLNKEIIIKLEEIYNNKTKNDENIILNPLIDDLLEDNIFKFKFNETNILIPLWHRELHFEDNDKSIYIFINPIVPNNIDIDSSSNNIIIHLREDIKNIFNKSEYYFNIGNKIFKIDNSYIKMLSYQEIILKRQGISSIDTNNVLDNSKRMDIIVKLEIYI